MSRTLQQLVAELSTRAGEYFTSTVTAQGTTTNQQFVDTSLNQWLPTSVGTAATSGANQYLNYWIYCTAATNASNVGVERRIQNFNATTSQVNLLTAFPAAISVGDTFEIHTRLPRARKVAAINDGIGTLGLFWARPIVDTSITTAVNTWTYTPTVQTWMTAPSRIDIQINTDATYTGFPYADAAPWNWYWRNPVTAAGAQTWTLQFVLQPPPERILRIEGDAYFSALSADSDVLPITGPLEAAALSWLYDWGLMRLMQQEAMRQPLNQTDMYWSKMQTLLQAQAPEVLKSAGKKQGRIVTPGRGTGHFDSGPTMDNPAWLGAFSGLQSA